MKYICIIVIAINTVIIGLNAYSSHMLRKTMPAVIFEANYYEIDQKIKPGSDTIALIATGKRQARLEWHNGRMRFIDAGVPMEESARAFLLQAAKTYNEAVKPKQ